VVEAVDDDACLGRSMQGGSGFGGRCGGGDALREEPVGLGHGSDPGQYRLLGQTMLQCGEHPLRAAARLRRVRRDQRDAKQGERRAETRPSRRSWRPSAPCASERTRQRRYGRSETPRTSAASPGLATARRVRW